MNKINHWAVILATSLQQLAGAAWYSEFLFGNIWLRETGLQLEELDPSNPVPYIISILTALLLSYIIAWMFYRFRFYYFRELFLFIFLMWLALGFSQNLLHGAFQGTSTNLLIIDQTHSLFNITITSLLIFYWKKRPRKK